MNRKWIIGIALIGALAVPAASWAHGGHTHKVLGTISNVQGTHVEIRTTDGKVVMVMLGQKTAITRGKASLDATALKAGERASVDYTQEPLLGLSHPTNRRPAAMARCAARR
jgi:hypothetical protein